MNQHLFGSVMAAIGLALGTSAVSAGIIDLGKNDRAPDGFYGP